MPPGFGYGSGPAFSEVREDGIPMGEFSTCAREAFLKSNGLQIRTSVPTLIFRFSLCSLETCVQYRDDGDLTSFLSRWYHTYVHRILHGPVCCQSCIFPWRRSASGNGYCPHQRCDAVSLNSWRRNDRSRLQITILLAMSSLLMPIYLIGQYASRVRMACGEMAVSKCTAYLQTRGYNRSRKWYLLILTTLYLV